MIIVIFVSLLIISAVIFAKNSTYGSDGLMALGFVGSALFGIITVIMIFIAVGNNVYNSGLIASNEERYKALIYKAQSYQSRDEFGIVNKSFIDEIQDWNEDVAEGKALQHDFWVGIFYPNIYDNFETIDINSITYRED